MNIDNNFLTYVNMMFNENCLERFQHHEKVYPNVEAYFKKNKEFLKQEYNKKTEGY